MKISRIDHLGIGVESIDAVLPYFENVLGLKKGGKGVHHVAFAVEDGVAEALVECEGKEIRLIDKAPRPGAENMMIGFLHPKSTAGILTELCEPKK